MEKEGERTPEEIKRKERRKRATTGINNKCASTDPKPAVYEEPCGKRAERKRKDWSNKPQGNSENLFFSESDKYSPPLAPSCRFPRQSI